MVAYCWWFLANHLWRWGHRRFRGRLYDLTYTPGINCFDADVLSVHVLFSDFYRQVRESLSLRRNPHRDFAAVGPPAALLQFDRRAGENRLPAPGSLDYGDLKKDSEEHRLLWQV